MPCPPSCSLEDRLLGSATHTPCCWHVVWGQCETVSDCLSQRCGAPYDPSKALGRLLYWSLEEEILQC